VFFKLDGHVAIVCTVHEVNTSSFPGRNQSRRDEPRVADKRRLASNRVLGVSDPYWTTNGNYCLLLNVKVHLEHARDGASLDKYF